MHGVGRQGSETGRVASGPGDQYARLLRNAQPAGAQLKSQRAWPMGVGEESGSPGLHAAADGCCGEGGSLSRGGAKSGAFSVAGRGKSRGDEKCSATLSTTLPTRV